MQVLTANDLRPDAALRRNIRRALAAEAAKERAAADLHGHTNNEDSLIDGPAQELRRPPAAGAGRPKTKVERMSSAAPVMDVDDEDEEMEDEGSYVDLGEGEAEGGDGEDYDE